MKQKKAVSEIMSYAILIAITITLAISVYGWLKYQIPNCDESDPNCFSSVDCPDGTFAVIDNYICNDTGLYIYLHNNGRFNLSGIILAVTDNTNQIPSAYLAPSSESMSGNFGEFVFNVPLRPGDVKLVHFSKNTKTGFLNKVEKIKMQIFINDGSRKLCKNVVLREDFQSCNFVQI